VTAPSARSILETLSKTRLLELGRAFGIAVPLNATKDLQIEALVAPGTLAFRELLAALSRDELKVACRSHDVDDTGRARTALAARLLQSRGTRETVPPKPIFTAHEIPRYAPRPGDIVQVRHRQWLVEAVTPPTDYGHATLVKLVCLDDDNQGRGLEVLWELELGAKVHRPEAHGLGDLRHVDPSEELEAQRGELANVGRQIEEAGEILERSRKVMDFDPTLLRDALEVGLELAGAGKLVPVAGADGEAWTMPELPDAWQDTLDSNCPRITPSPRRTKDDFVDRRRSTWPL